MRIAVGSGKGGVGKTFFTASLISYLSKQMNVLSIDGDVDAPNLALALGVDKFENRKEIFISKTAVINDTCIKCMRCVDVCNYYAINPPKVDGHLCEGCGACSYVCPVNAIDIVKRKTGEILWGRTKYGYVVTAQLELGRSGSGMLVDEEKKIAGEIMKKEEIDMSIIDVPAGIGCTAISSISGSDLFIGIVEPSPQSLHDLERVLKIVKHFKIPYYIIINKYDLTDFSNEIEKKFDVIGKIPFDDNVPKSISSMKPMIDAFPDSPASSELRNIFERIKNLNHR